MFPSVRVFLPAVAVTVLILVSCTGGQFASPDRGADSVIAAPVNLQLMEGTIRDLQKTDKVVPGEVVLKLVEGGAIEPIVEQWNLTLIEYNEVLGFYHFALPEGADLASTVVELDKDPRIEVAEPVYRTRMCALRVDPDDPRFVQGDQWYLENMDVPEAWVIEPGDPAVEEVPEVSDVVVAVLDTGIDYNHPDLAPTAPGPFDMKILPGHDYVNGDSNPQDDNGHGTMISGIIGARTNNANGIAGVAWNPRLIPVKVLDQEGNGTTVRTADGIVFAVHQFLAAKDMIDPYDAKGSIFANPFNARLIINMSYMMAMPDSLPPSAMEKNAISYAISHGALLVASAGDQARPLDDGNTTIYPASYTGVIAVGATDQANAIWPDSNSLSPDANPATSAFFVAPGVNIVSTFLSSYSGGYAVGTGTSFAAANLSGVAALIWSQFPFLSQSEVIGTLADGADADIVGGLGPDFVSGRGLINAFESLQKSFTPTPTNDPLIVRAFTNPILHGDVIFVIKSHYRMLQPVDATDLNGGFPFKYTIGWDYDLDGTIDAVFPQLYLLNINYWRHEVYFGMVDSATYVGRVHFAQDLSPVLTPTPYPMGQLMIEFTGVPANGKIDATLPQTVTGSTTIQIDEFNYDLPG